MAKGQTNPDIIEDELNRSMPAAARAALGTKLRELIEKHNALLVKLDADGGVTATNFAATLSITPPEDMT